jgi:hypothetical protein
LQIDIPVQTTSKDSFAAELVDDGVNSRRKVQNVHAPGWQAGLEFDPLIGSLPLEERARRRRPVRRSVDKASNRPNFSSDRVFCGAHAAIFRFLLHICPVNMSVAAVCESRSHMIEP